MRKSTQLPRTSRVSEKIYEYYLKFGQDRDLEKYMRLYSPCEHRNDCKSRSSTTNSSCHSEDEGRIFRRLFHQETEMTTESDSDMKEFIVPIERQTDNMTDKRVKPKRDECTASAPDLHTPPPSKGRNTNPKQTQTPDSVAKSHRRLEWDSLGDVGYKKSLSTSNISVLERSVLREYFHEISSVGATKKNDSKSQQAKQNLDGQNKTQKANNSSKIHLTENSNTPPLASSTMMQSKTNKNSKEAEPLTNLVSRSTSMSLQKRYDQYCQTSVQRLPQQTSREVQVTLSSATSGASSNAAGTATPSSFDYYSSRSAQSTTDGEIAVSKVSSKSGSKSKIKPKVYEEQMHPFVAGINEMLACRKVVSKQKENEVTLQEVSNNLKEALNDNKENSTTSSTLSNYPQVDLGIQLLCSIIDARSLNRKQKTRLVRDIVKRISRLNGNDDVNREEVNLIATLSREISAVHTTEKQNVEATLKSTSAITIPRAAKDSMDLSNLAHALPSSTSSDEINEQLVQVEVLKKPSLPTTSAKALAKLRKENISYAKEKTHQRISAGTQVDMESFNIEGNSNSLKSQEEAIEREPAAQGADLEAASASKVSSASKEKVVEEASSTSIASSTSKDVTTQKPLINLEIPASSDTEAAVSANTTMREWLNPMTQSEIEYEQKKQEFSKHGTKKEKVNKRVVDNQKLDLERKTQLKWLQAEIKRLETLRCLLLKSNKVQEMSAENLVKLYDTVFSDSKTPTTTSSTVTTAENSESDKPMQEIEVIIEESNEDVIKLDEKMKCTKQRKRETQIVYDKPNDAENIYNNLVAGKARFRIMTETITTNEEQVLSAENVMPNEPTPMEPPKQIPIVSQRPEQPQQQQQQHPQRQQQQRSKIDTPSSESNSGESIRSFAEQRKREFLEQYRNKKRIHYETLLHKQQQMLIQQQQQIIHELQQRCNTITHTTTVAPTAGPYSVPHHMPKAYCPCVSEQQPYHQTYYQPQLNIGRTSKAPKNVQPQYPPPCAPPCPPRVQPQQGAELSYQRQTVHSEQSTSSIFCISSEVSIPMGTSSTTNSTTTTTHQYDDVAAVSACVPGVGVQTGNSLRRSQPIFGKRLHYDCTQADTGMRKWDAYNPQPVCSGQSVCVQVKPKAIAYVIQFEKKTTSSTTTTTTTTATASTSNSNLITKPSNEISDLREVVPEPCALQDYLVRANPRFVTHTKERKAILNQIQMLRQDRGRELRDIIENASETSLDSRLQRLPPPATKRLRIFATREMKAMTQRHCENLPEVVKRHERAREERRRHGNRLIRDIFNQRLQRRVHSGKLSLNHSKTVI